MGNAKLSISPEMLLSAVFHECNPKPDLEIVEASFDHERGVVQLHVRGHDVPEGAKEIIGIFQRQYTTVKFDSI